MKESSQPLLQEALVLRSSGSQYRVKTLQGDLVDCVVKGRFRLKGIRSTTPVAVGDRVMVSVSQGEVGMIHAIKNRKNYLIRKASNLSKASHILGANLDCAVLVVTVVNPQTSTVFIDRFLASAEAYRIPVKLVFNKTDIYSPEDSSYMQALCRLYTEIGYSCQGVSAETGQGIAELYAALVNKVSLFSGHSGVGKSTLINALVPGAARRTAEISHYHHMGMHTTTYSEMIPLKEGGYLIDTPGIKGFGTFDMGEQEISHYFPEIFAEAVGCRYGNCTHTHEPGCAVRAAVQEQRISQSRYASYLNILEDEGEDKYRSSY